MKTGVGLPVKGFAVIVSTTTYLKCVGMVG